ncbi:MAG: hypothetical protein H0U74_07930 [Bradymonadaceae bacterium]|nr:hypothetical protein [Lujinxingiaceae bacterium]
MRNVAALALVLLLAACGDNGESSLGGAIDFEPNRPTLGKETAAAPAYSGNNPLVQEAAERFRTGSDLHRKVIIRTCGPNGGVCHNQKEYPDLRTPGSFLATINAPCNVQPGDFSSVDDRCELLGDRFKFDNQGFKEIEIGHLQYIAGEHEDYKDGNKPDASSPGLHVHLREAVPLDREQLHAGGQFIRTFVNDQQIVEDLTFATFGSRWWILEGGKHLVAEVRSYQVDRINELLAVGIIQGDVNRNSVFGARASKPVPLIKPGKPEESYLVGRLRGLMGGEEVPGSRMPLANQPLTIPEMLALFCFIEGLPANGSHPSMSDAIDYKSCSYTADPESLNLLGAGVTWKGRVSKIFQANCSGCHGGSEPPEGLDLRNDEAYGQLFELSKQKPELRLIEAGEPEASYLWLKLIGDESITGYPMPYNPLTGEGKLREGELGDVQTWIVNGAILDE